MTTPKLYLSRRQNGDTVEKQIIEASDWTEAMSKAIVQASVDQVELVGIEVIQEPSGAAEIPMQEPMKVRESSSVKNHCGLCGVEIPIGESRCHKCVKQYTPDVHQQILQELKNVNARLASIQSEHGEFREETRLYRLREA